VNTLANTPYKISWVEDEFGVDPADDNVDVLVDFASGERYTATFFTLDNLRSLMERYRETGQCANGLYLWSAQMIIITRLTKANVEQAVAELLATGEFTKVFEGPFALEG
jgi:hypothetical protein